MFFLSDIMKFFIVFALAFATVWAKDLYSRSIEVPVIENGGRIVNGKSASTEKFNYQVGINFKKDEYNWCGGSLIGENWVLTAAQCIYGASLANVYLGGTVRTFAEASCTAYKKDMIMYPGWVNNMRTGDIGLVRVRKEKRTHKLGTIKLPRNNDNQYLGAKVVVFGWGQSSDFFRGLSVDLQYADLEVSPPMDCYNVFGNKYVFAGHICVATPNLVSPCLNDNGGPLVVEGQRIQIGVFSFGYEEGCEKGYPTVFTRVSSYLPWIRHETGI